MLLGYSAQQLGNSVQQTRKNVRRGMSEASVRLLFWGRRDQQDS